MEIKKAEFDDLTQILALYAQLGKNPIPPVLPTALWAQILAQPNHHILAAWEDGRIVSSCTLSIIFNLTHGGRPYALIENVVTDKDFRGRGLATACLARAREIAEAAGCYKIMLLTGSKKEETLRFYEKAGYNRGDKTAFVLWLS